MINLPNYADYGSVRAALGVSIQELPDAVLDRDIYAFYVQNQLDEVSPTLRAEFEAITPPGSTDDEIAKYDAVRVLSAYAAARVATISLPLFSPKTISDGKGTMTRYSDSPYEAVISEVNRMYLYYLAALKDLIGEVAVDTSQVLISVSSLDTDPVTG